MEYNRICGFKKRIEKLGINSTIGNWFGSSDISIGEWQRLAIARAFYREADVYFLMRLMLL